MRKHSKFITVLLSAVLAVCLLQTVFVQAFATEVNDDDYSYGDVATDDEPEESLYPVSMKVVKAPKSVHVRNRQITDADFWKNVVLHIVYSDGQEFDVNCDGIDSDDGIVPPIAEINEYKGEISTGFSTLEFNHGNTVDFSIIYRYREYDYSGYYTGDSEISTDFSVERKADPHAIVKFEVTKLPNKVFTAPFVYPDSDFMSPKVLKNAISHHIDGLEITYYYANGEKGAVTFDSSMVSEVFAEDIVRYGTDELDEYGNCIRIEIRDLGNYMFSVSFLDYPDIDDPTYRAKSVDNPNPSIKPVSTEDTPSKPSNNIPSSTSDNATKDSANRANGTANNGVVATGDFATPAIIAVVMIAAAAVMFVLKRKQTL